MSHARRPHVRSALSLIEILVVIAIIGVLIALLLPAIQHVRQLAALTQCANNLHQLSVAAANYASQHKNTLPPGYIGPLKNNSSDTAIAYGDPADNQWVGHLPLLLPFLEQDGLRTQTTVNFDIDAQEPPWWEPPPAGSTLPPNYQTATQTVPVFRCPSDPDLPVQFQPGSGNHGTVVGIHAYNKGPFVYVFRRQDDYDDGSGAAVGWRLGITNYVGVSGGAKGTSAWWRRYEGVYTNRSATKINAIADGASNTLMYGEVSGRSETDADKKLLYNALNISWFGGGALPTAWGIGSGEQALWHQFSSRHPGGAQFAFCDGSVRLLRFNVNPSILLEQAGMNDTAVVPAD